MPTALIIGAGLAGLRTASELRTHSYPGKIILIGAEDLAPYDRPPLSSKLLSDPEPVWLAEDLSIEWPGVADEVHLGVRATSLTIGPVSQVHLDDGRTIVGEDVVIATGSTALNPWPGTYTLTTYADAEAIRAALADGAKQVVVIGAGWVGTELSRALHAAGHAVTTIESGPEPLAAQLGVAGAHIRPWFTGINLHTGVQVTAVDSVETGYAVHTDALDVIEADIVITAVGMRPATEWLAGSGIPVDDRGFIPVETTGRVEGTRVWAVGDVATRTHPVFGLVRGGHWFSALRDPEHIAADIAQVERSIASHAPEVFSNQGDHHVEVFGSLVGDQTVLRGDPLGGTWVLFHLREGNLIGAVIANSPRDTSAIRRALGRSELLALTPEELTDETVPLRKLLKR